MRCVRDATGWTTYLEPHEIPAVETLYANMTDSDCPPARPLRRLQMWSGLMTLADRVLACLECSECWDQELMDFAAIVFGWSKNAL
jgi:hypothetical protein